MLFPSNEPSTKVMRHTERSQNGVQTPKFDVFHMNVDNKALKVCYKVPLSKTFQPQSCSAINYLTKGINILAGDDPVPLKFGPKGTDPQ